MAPRALVLAWQVPYPPDQGGKIRTFHLLTALREMGPVTLLCFQTDPVQDDWVEHLRRRGLAVRAVPIRFPALRWWHHFRRGTPLLAQQYESEAMREAIQHALARERYDVVAVDGLMMAQYARGIRGVPVIYQSHNVESEVYRRTLHLLKLRPRARAGARLDCWKLERVERRWVRGFRFAMAVSERDRDVLRRWNPRALVAVVPNGVDTDYFRPEPGRVPEPGAIAFTGTLSYPPNRDAVLFFAREILPRILARLPGVRWYVVGQGSPDLGDALRREAGVVFTGYVEDVREYLARAQAVVVPLRTGGGTRLKILEAMAMGRPVVSTTLGAEGLILNEGREIRIADEPAAFADAVVDVLRDPARAAHMAAAGRERVLTTYAWHRIRETYRDLVRRICEQEGRPGPAEAVRT